jgi:hypothetical protein
MHRNNAINSINWAEYIRERRLFAAARDLVTTKQSVIDIAFEYCYSSHESFLRAFKALYGIPPREFRRRGTIPSFMSKINLLDSAYYGAKGGSLMNPKIVDQDSFRIIGTHIRTRHGSCHDDVSNLLIQCTVSASAPATAAHVPGMEMRRISHLERLFSIS